jgi:hypothetical protein
MELICNSFDMIMWLFDCYIGKNHGRIYLAIKTMKMEMLFT